MNNFNFGKMNEPITFYEMKSGNNDGRPTKPKLTEVYKTFAKIESLSMRDYQTAMQNNTQNEITILIRDYPLINNKMKIKLNGNSVEFKINFLQENYRESRITFIKAEAVTQ